MKRSAKQAAKESAETQKQILRNKELNKQALKEKSEADAQLAIQRNNQRAGFVGMTLNGLVFEHQNLLWKKGSRLFRKEYVSKLNALNKLQPHWKHGLTSWHPKGKAPETLYLSLCDHLFAKYHMPNFLWSGLEDDRTAGLVIKIAAGASPL